MFSCTHAINLKEIRLYSSSIERLKNRTSGHEARQADLKIASMGTKSDKQIKK